MTDKWFDRVVSFAIVCLSVAILALSVDIIVGLFR